MARLFRAVLKNHYVTMETLDSLEDKETLAECFRRGWLHATAVEDEDQYIFTTPLHRWFIEYYLGTRVVDTTPITDQTLLSFVIEVIRGFSPQTLSSREKIGALKKQNPPDAHFQDEFYRGCHESSKGSFISFPESGNARGKIDFYIPRGEWGVELLRDGDRLKDHSSRFEGQGAYANMNFKDYVTLDFRTKEPQKTHPSL
jgi:hypothetical protein